jgi:DNA mismatch repair protein MutS
VHAPECTVRALSASSGSVRVSHPSLSALSDAIQDLQARTAAEAGVQYKNFLRGSGPLCESLAALLPALSELDVAATNARNAADYGYACPEVVEVQDAPAFLDARGLRHPIIERVQEGLAYTPNDVQLTADRAAWLLFGINAAGKSSLMKSIGLAVLMAQAGMFVAAEALTLAPYHHVFTRICSGDDIWRGMSTFVVEMTELRNILQRCSHKSLVLGDELCAGTEAVSAAAIVAAGVRWLLDRRATFVFATHLHELRDLVADERLAVKHMHVEVEADGTLVYERALRDGAGHATYGLEVCRGLGLPDAFLRDADAVRRRLMGVPANVVDAKASRYSRKVLVHRCGVCGGQATETHHVVYQREAAPGANRPSNLAPLCEACHLAEHAGRLRIHGYQATSQGRRLAVDEKK